MTAFQKYQVWMQRSREPALLTPTSRFWLGVAFAMTFMHLGINAQHLMGEMPFAVLLPLILAITCGSILLPPVVFQRYVGDLNLGQSPRTLNFAIGLRICTMAAIYGWIALPISAPFNPMILFKLPAAILIGGLVFEITLGQIAYFKPTQANKISTLESAA